MPAAPLTTAYYLAIVRYTAVNFLVGGPQEWKRLHWVRVTAHTSVSHCTQNHCDMQCAVICNLADLHTGMPRFGCCKSWFVGMTQLPGLPYHYIMYKQETSCTSWSRCNTLCSNKLKEQKAPLGVMTGASVPRSSLSLTSWHAACQLQCYMTHWRGSCFCGSCTGWPLLVNRLYNKAATDASQHWAQTKLRVALSKQGIRI